MSLPPGTRLGPYQIEAVVGAGGMGEVYRARDTRLDRLVAIKKSLGPFNERFEREARAIGKLNHPHICALYDVGPDYLVMEYLEGRPLTGPMPLDEALALARQILDAIDAAHSHGIVHRDLKPSNILLTKAGVKVLDFGLAKAVQTTAAGLATATAPLTGVGAIVGTLHYMSPEQLEGKEADERSDIFSFGLVFYELLTGRRVFDGESQASVIAAVLKEQPKPISQVQPAAPKSLDRIVQTCLEKDPAKRWQSAREIKHALEWSTSDAGATVSMPAAADRRPSRTTLRFWQAVAAASLLVAVSALAWALRPAPAPELPLVRFEIQPPKGTRFETYVAMSPDGQHIAFTAIGADGNVRLWVRDLKAIEARELPGTAGVGSIIWSPDSRYIAFAHETQLKKVDIAGGPPQTLCQVATPVGSGSWSEKGIILFGGKGAGGVHRVAESGGVATPLTTGPGFASFPTLLPDGQHFLYYRQGAVLVGALDVKPEAQSTKVVLSTSLGPVFEPTTDAAGGRLLFIRENTLMVQPFDVKALALTGDAVPFTDGVITVNQYPGVSVSRNGTLAFRQGTPLNGRVLTWLDRTGKTIRTVGDPGVYVQLALSPDNSRLAYRDNLPAVPGDIWIMDLTRGVSSKFTFNRSIGGYPVWSPDGRYLAFNEGADLFQKLASGGGEAELLIKSPTRKAPTSWSKDGKYLFLTALGANDLEVLQLAGRTTFPFLATPNNELTARVSPDGRWVAYSSNEAIRPEVFVRPFNPPGSPAGASAGKWQVTRNGADQPFWRADGKELFFREQPSGAVFAVDVKTSTTFEPGLPRQLFSPGPQSVAVSSDGQRFLTSLSSQQDSEAPITVILNWASALNRSPK